MSRADAWTACRVASSRGQGSGSGRSRCTASGVRATASCQLGPAPVAPFQDLSGLGAWLSMQTQLAWTRSRMHRVPQGRYATKGRIQDADLRGPRLPLPGPPARHTRRARPPPRVLESVSNPGRHPAVPFGTRPDGDPPLPARMRGLRPSPVSTARAVRPLLGPGRESGSYCVAPHRQSQEPRRAGGVANCRASRHRRPEAGRRQEPRPAQQPRDGNAPQVLTKFQSRGPTTGPALLAQPFRTCRATSRTELRI